VKAIVGRMIEISHGGNIPSASVRAAVFPGNVSKLFKSSELNVEAVYNGHCLSTNST
jgi:hypothetical protein